MVMSVSPSIRPSRSRSGSPSVSHSFFPHFLPTFFDIFYVTFFLWTFDQVRVSSISVNFVGVIPLLEFKILEINSFPPFSPTCFNILGWNVAYDFVLQVRVSPISVNYCWKYHVMSLSERRILIIHSFSHFSPTSFDILSWNFVYDFV